MITCDWETMNIDHCTAIVLNKHNHGCLMDVVADGLSTSSSACKYVFANLLKIKWISFKAQGRNKETFLVYKLTDKMLCCTVSNLFNSFNIVLLSPKSTFMTSLFYILQYSVCLNTPLLFTPPPHPRSFGVLRSSAPELCHGSLATQKLQISLLLFYSG